MRVVVCTIVHHPADARIYHRQIRALLDAGHDVTYIAPFDAEHFYPERRGSLLRVISVPRAAGRRRLGALLAARRALAANSAGADLLLIHDPELLLALPPRRKRPPTIWDVHEDTAAALSTKPWLPRPLRPATALAVHAAERTAERRVHLILAEQGYVSRFRHPHPVVPNTTYVPETPAAPAAPGDDQRVIYVGPPVPGPRRRRDDRAGRAAAPARHLGGAGRPGRRAGPRADRARAGRGPDPLARVRPERSSHAHDRRRGSRSFPAPGRAELPALHAHQGRRVHGARGAGGDHAPTGRRRARHPLRVRARGAVRRSPARRRTRCSNSQGTPHCGRRWAAAGTRPRTVSSAGPPTPGPSSPSWRPGRRRKLA